MTTYTGAELIRQMDTLKVAPGCLAIWGLGQMGVALKGDDQGIVYIDPCLSNVVVEKAPELADKFVRAFPPPLEPEQITNAAYVLCSHEHNDHTDPLTLGPLAAASPQARFVISGWAQEMLDEADIDPARRIVASTDEPLQLGNLRVTSVPAAHYECEYDEARGYRWLGFVIEWNGVTFFHTGDTVIYPGYLDQLRTLPRADVAMAAVNGRDAFRDSFNIIGNLWPVEAGWLAHELGWDLVLAGHNDLYAWNTIAPGQIAEGLIRHNPRQKWHVLQPGELLYYVR